MSLPDKPPAKINGKLSKLSDDEKARIAAEILEEYQAGGSVKDSAAKRGISSASAYGLLARHVLDGFRDAQAAVALDALEAAEAAIENADDHLQLGKAERLVKAAQWKLERVLRSVYGQQAAATPTTPVTIMISNLRGNGGPPIEIRTVAADQTEPETRSADVAMLPSTKPEKVNALRPAKAKS